MTFAALCAAMAGCSAPPVGPDAHVPLADALASAARAQGCAAELVQAVERDPAVTAAQAGVEPAALAPWGGPSRGRDALRDAIRARAASARESARAARSLSLLGEHASAQQEALRREKIARSLADSAALCGAADGVRGGLLAQRREPAAP